MTCKHCCGADQLFDLKSAQKEMKKYKKKGAGKSTRKLLSLMYSLNQKNQTLLDIGGGIGAIQWAFMENGGNKTTDVDSSSGYLHVAQEYAAEKGFDTEFKMADFNDVANEVEAHDIVTLDKVVCCYPDYKLLLGNALDKADKALAMTMPLGGFVSKALGQLTRAYLMIKKNPFRTYVHNPSEVQSFIESKGFRLSSKGFSFPWLVRVYERI